MEEGKGVTSFHVRHDFTPTQARETLLLLLSSPATGNDEIVTRARAHGLELGRRQSADKVLASLRDLGLLQQPERSTRHFINLTPLGTSVAAIGLKDPLLLAELIHLRYYFLWSLHGRVDHFSWAYRVVCNALWETAPTPLDSDFLVTTVLTAADKEFAIASASFSTSSVLGITHWLRELSPPCLDDSLFRRRPACPTEVFVLALEAVRRAEDSVLNAPLTIHPSTKEMVCRALLLDEQGFDEMLEQTSETLGVMRRHTGHGDVVLIRDSFLPELIS
jgi:hypothetical protein